MDIKGRWHSLNNKVLWIGGGLQHYDHGNVKYMRLAYGEGLRVPNQNWRAWDREKYFYQKSSFARGYIWHHRSNATQQWLFHWLYGGVKGFFIQRWVVDFGLRVWCRIAFLPLSFHFIGGCLGQREYDCNAYDYFYFSDWVKLIIQLLAWNTPDRRNKVTLFYERLYGRAGVQPYPGQF